MLYTVIDPSSDRTVAREGRSSGSCWTTRGGLLYVAAWLAGLAVKPAGVTSGDTAATIASNYVDHRIVSMAQVVLVHGVAAIALLGFGVGLSRLAESTAQTRAARWCRRTTSLVVLASLLQAVLGVVMIATAGSAASSTTRGLLLGVERLDAVKLVALAGLCSAGITLSRRGVLARWTGRAAEAAIVCLLGAALALAGAVPALVPIAVPALVLLLVWVGGVASSARRMEA